mgnify:CR=1 FL=1
MMGMDRKTDFCTMKNGQPYIFLNTGYMRLTIDKTVVVTGRYFWNRKCRKITWKFAVFKCEATANSVTGYVCVNRKRRTENEKTIGTFKIDGVCRELPLSDISIMDFVGGQCIAGAGAVLVPVAYHT